MIIVHRRSNCAFSVVFLRWNELYYFTLFHSMMMEFRSTRITVANVRSKWILLLMDVVVALASFIINKIFQIQSIRLLGKLKLVLSLSMSRKWHSVISAVVVRCCFYSLRCIYNSVFAFFGLPLRSSVFNSLVACLAIYFTKSSTSRPPSYFCGDDFESFGNQKSVGNPRTSNCGGTSLAVASNFTIATSSSLNFSPSSSNTGANFLQCPHHGA